MLGTWTEEEASTKQAIILEILHFILCSLLYWTKHLQEILSTYKAVIFFSWVRHNLHIEDVWKTYWFFFIVFISLILLLENCVNNDTQREYSKWLLTLHRCIFSIHNSQTDINDISWMSKMRIEDHSSSML